MRRIILIWALLILMPHKACCAMELSARSACLMAADSAQVIFEKNSSERAPMASTTKMMTALLAARYGGWEEEVIASPNAVNQEGSKIYLSADDKMSLYDLTCGMMLNSGNDAAMAIAEHIGGNCEEFAEQMTRCAKELGAVNTQFKNPNGLDEPGHYSTAYDLALIAREVINDEDLKQIVGCRQMTITSKNKTVTYLKNHNKMLWNYDGITGVKTGFTKASGRCLVTSCERNGVRLIAVTINAPDDWNDHKKLLDYGFAKCEKKQIVSRGEELASVNIGGEKLKYVAKEAALADCIDKRTKECEIILNRIHQPQAPINEGEKLGIARVVQNGYEIAQIELVADRDIYYIAENGIVSKIKNFFTKLLK